MVPLVSHYYRPIKTSNKKNRVFSMIGFLLSANLIAVDTFSYLQT
nr:MAG TPA: hypothetical protein [Caudoviricetes sp.]